MQKASPPDAPPASAPPASAPSAAGSPHDTARRRLAVIAGRPLPLDERLRQVVGVLHSEFAHFDWVGIYMVEAEELVLHNYIGRPTPHRRIPVGQGICGASVQENDTIVVDDVKSDPRYIACSAETASEIVVPIRSGDRVVAQIDIDSDTPAVFTTEDRVFIERVAADLARFFSA